MCRAVVLGFKFKNLQECDCSLQVMSSRTLGFGLAALGTAGAGYYRSDDVHTAVRCGRCVVTAGGCLLDYSSGLPMKEAHARASHRLRECLQANRGLYIKVGQHLGVLDYVLPPEYLDAMSCFYDAAPQSSWTSVERVIREDFGLVGKKGVDELFESIDHTPLASGSLAQVSERRRGESTERVCERERWVCEREMGVCEREMSDRERERERNVCVCVCVCVCESARVGVRVY